jgi:hypothetical protein
MADTQSPTAYAEMAKALMAVVNATRAYLPPDGIDAQECLNRILGATDNATINPIIFEIERAAACDAEI